ncbi:hypothetical protein BaRGS_00022300 [Batillaria attramentaria]|uniref:Uncharacterized protein n=1 Tax=Batillaria attramentaria TaxID=370345 RepID=A0ABD0KH71_9CAEN
MLTDVALRKDNGQITNPETQSVCLLLNMLYDVCCQPESAEAATKYHKRKGEIFPKTTYPQNGIAEFLFPSLKHAHTRLPVTDMTTSCVAAECVKQLGLEKLFGK